MKYAKTDSKKALVYLHGFLGNKYTWRSVMEELPTPHIQIALDLPGHGEAKKFEMTHWPSKKEESSYFQHYMDLLREDLETTLKEEKIDSICLVGYSMGARMALQLALSNSINIDALVIESSGAGIPKEERESRRVFDQELQKKLLEKNPDAFLEEWYNYSLFKGIKQCQGFEAMKENILKNDFHSIASSLAYSSQSVMPNIWEKLNDVTIRTLIFCGDKDEKYKKISKELHFYMKNSEWMVLKEASHNVHFMDKKSYIKTLSQFLDKIHYGN